MSSSWSVLTSFTGNSILWATARTALLSASACRIWVFFATRESKLCTSLSGLIVSVCLGDRPSRSLHPIQRDSCLLRPFTRANTVSEARAAVPRDSFRLPLKGSWCTLPALFKHNCPFSKSVLAPIFFKKSAYDGVCVCGQIAHTKLMGIRFPIVIITRCSPFKRSSSPVTPKGVTLVRLISIVHTPG